MPGRHKDNTKEFRKLEFAEQAKSISATIMNLEAAIDNHINSPHSKGKVTSDKCKTQVENMLIRLKAKYH